MNSDVNIFERIIEKTTNIIGIISGVLLGALTVVVFGEIVLREVFGKPFPPTNELTLILFPWLAFLAAINITKNEENISLTFFKDSLPTLIRNKVIILIRVSMLIFSVIMTVGSFKISRELSKQILPVLGVSKVFLYGSVFVSFLGISIVLVYQIYGLLFRKNDKEGDS